LVQDASQGFWVILATFAVAIVFALVPLPPWLLWARPEWLALTLIYWVIALPHRVGIFTAVTLGITLDVLEGAVIGQNAAALIVLALLALTLYQRVRVFSLVQQSGVVFVLIGINQLVCQWIQNLQGAGADTLLFLLPALTSALLWPVILHVLRALRRNYQVN